jgi:hypothetical protein
MTTNSEDPMLERQAHRVASPFTLWLVLFVARICRIASSSGKRYDHAFSPVGQLLKRVVEVTHTSKLILAILVRGSSDVLGLGQENIVKRSRSGRTVLKYNSAFAGTEPAYLQSKIRQANLLLSLFEQELGDVVPTSAYSIAALPLRGMGGLQTLCLEQPLLETPVDVFEIAMDQLSVAARRSLRAQIKHCVRGIRRLAEKNVWVDLVGTGNLAVVLPTPNTPKLILMDTEPHPNIYLDVKSPTQNKTHRQIFWENLATLERL